MKVRAAIVIGGGASLFMLAMCHAAPAHEFPDYAAPDVGQWYATLMQPDNDTGCCGDGDAYYADKRDVCRADDFKQYEDCAFVAIITDTRPDRIVRKDGTVIQRVHLAVGTRVPIPKRKIRREPIPNPTQHNVVFVWADPYKPSERRTICWEPVADL